MLDKCWTRGLGHSHPPLPPSSPKSTPSTPSPFPVRGKSDNIQPFLRGSHGHIRHQRAGQGCSFQGRPWHNEVMWAGYLRGRPRSSGWDSAHRRAVGRLTS